jgi:hypothetical protein
MGTNVGKKIEGRKIGEKNFIFLPSMFLPASPSPVSCKRLYLAVSSGVKLPIAILERHAAYRNSYPLWVSCRFNFCR